MKILMLIALCVSLSVATLAQNSGQSTSQSGSQATQGSQSQGSQSQGSQDQTSTSTSGSQNMSGTVSHDRKNFTNDKNNKQYRVDNPDALQGQADQHVALIVHVDPDSNVIHIIQVEPQQ
ncbi:MAG: hypothetical protein DMG71_16650 [Acidobacteria bacterium]|nr:MAG: hypothetical protein DMG71_16650 [Acidobacteriota bacterium]